VGRRPHPGRPLGRAMGAAASLLIDPLALCHEAPEVESGRACSREEARSPPRQRYHDRTALHAEEDELQRAIMKSLQEQGPAEETELQEALHQSSLEAAGIVHTGPPPEEVTEATRQLMDLLFVLGLERLDVGSTNMSEGGNILSNQCFYLAIARSWLADAASAGGMLVRDSALQLKREIEARVLRVRGSSAENDIGEEREAYADYLVCAMQNEGSECQGGAATDLAIAVFASLSGGLEAYEGSGYSKLPREQRVANLSLIWHRAGHFEAIVAAGSGGKADLTLEELLNQADAKDIPTAAIRA